MVETRIAPGRYANILERPGTTLSASQVASALYPLSYLADGRPSRKFIFPAVAADDYVQADINQVLNGQLDDWTGGAPDSWTEETTNDGTVTEQTVTQIVSGSGALLQNGTTGTAAIYQDVLCLAGESMLLDLNARTSNADSPNLVEVQNLLTGNYLTSGGTWQAAQTNTLSLTNTGLTQATRSFTVEDFDTCRSHIVYLRLRLHMTGSPASRQHNYDDVFMIPGVNAASVHGHNIDPRVVAQLRSSEDTTDIAAFSVDDDLEATFTVAVPSFYAVLGSTVTKRLWRIPKFVGTNSTVTGSIALGEVALLQTRNLLRAPKNRDLETAELVPQEVSRAHISGEEWRLQQSQFKRRSVRLSFNHTQTMQTQYKAELLERTRHGVDPMFIIVRDDRTSACLHGRKEEGETIFRGVGGLVESTEITILESAYGVVTE